MERIGDGLARLGGVEGVIRRGLEAKRIVDPCALCGHGLEDHDLDRGVCEGGRVGSCECQGYEPSEEPEND